ncbi:MAG: HEAT repeat domain-containing protein [Planctomycetota bacterium]
MSQLAYTVLILLACSLVPAWGQMDVSDESVPDLHEVLARVSFNGNTTPDELGAALANLEAQDLTALCDMLTEPDTADDTQARMALQGLTWYLGSVGTTEQQAKYVDVLCAALKQDKVPAVKAFLIRQLQLLADERAVPVLAAFLHDEELYDFAAQALLAIGGDQAAQAFYRAYPGAEGARRVAIIDALGLLRSSLGRQVLLEEAADQSGTNTTAALVASGDVMCQDLRLAMVQAPPTSSRYELSRRAHAHLCWIKNRALQLPLANRLQSYRNDLTHWIVYHVIQAEPQYHSAALYAMADLGGQRVAHELVKALGNRDPEVRAATAEIAASMPGPEMTQALLKAFDSTEPARKVVILEILRRRGDRAAASVVERALSDDNVEVRLAGLTALPVLAPDLVVQRLISFLHTCRDDTERQAAQRELVRLQGPRVVEQLGIAMDNAPTAVRIALIEVLADRRADTQLSRLLFAARQGDPDVRLAAIRALERIGDIETMPELLSLLIGVDNERERLALEAALAVTCKRPDDPAAGAELILAKLDPTNEQQYISLLRVLGHIGGNAALEAVQPALSDKREPVRQAAFHALLEWPDVAAVPDILDIARQTDELKYHVLAMRAFARLVASDTERETASLLALYDDGLGVARRVEERRLLLSKLGTLKKSETILLLERFLEDEDLADEAAMALINVADGLLPANWQSAQTTLNHILAINTNENVVQRAMEALTRTSQYEDYITQWCVAGPYTRPQMNGQELFEVVFPPEQDEAQVKWVVRPASENPELFWLIDLQADQSIRGDNRAAYLTARINSPTEQDARLEVGSDDGIKIWLNGEVVHANNALRGCTPRADMVAAKLRAGWNRLLVKVTNNGGGWAASVRVRAPDGNHLENLKFDANCQP